MKTIGVMTGNSLDGADVVLTAFEKEKIKDLAAYSLPFPADLTQDLLALRAVVRNREMDCLRSDPFFNRVLDRYTVLVAEAVNRLCSDNQIDKAGIAAIGFHGQTCDHFPPSIAGGKKPYTLQIADAQGLADLTDIPVIYDFRSDDLMNGGEGAPLAPAHNAHLAADLKSKGSDSVAFCNAGNTGNIAVVAGKTVLGWDVGPFNHFSDKLVREHKNEPCDRDGKFGRKGKIRPELLKTLFDTAAVTQSGANFFWQVPPKSSDPSWYVLPPSSFSFEDTLRTVEYLSTYAFFHTLSFIPEAVKMPQAFLVFGGGWKNPLTLADFQSLLKGTAFVLPEHQKLFCRLLSRFEKEPLLASSDEFGYSGTYMEARIFADMAYSRIIGRPFSFPESTGCRTPTVAGIFCLPQTGRKYLISDYLETPDVWREKWSRASKGWF